MPYLDVWDTTNNLMNAAQHNASSLAAMAAQLNAMNSKLTLALQTIALLIELMPQEVKAAADVTAAACEIPILNLGEKPIEQ